MTHVIFSQITGDHDRSGEAEVRRRVSLWPQTRTFEDIAGHEMERFHVHTSGQILLFDRGGALLYNGGLTVARGHEGESAAQRMILHAVATGEAIRESLPVYGCPLATPDEK